MKRPIYWIAFLLTLALPLLYYSGSTLFLLIQYARLDEQVPLHSIEWSVLEMSDEKFSPSAHYTFNYKGIWYEGNDSWSDYSLNRWAAREKIKSLKQTIQAVWVRSSNPSFSKLENHFPLKQILSMLVLWGLFLYFIFLGRYIIGFPQSI